MYPGPEFVNSGGRKQPPFAVSLIYLWYNFMVRPNIDREGTTMKQMLRKRDIWVFLAALIGAFACMTLI